MAALDDLNSEVTALNTSVSNLIAVVTTDLQNAQGSDGSVAAADVEAAVAKLKSIQSTLDTETATITPAAPAPPAAS